MQAGCASRRGILTPFAADFAAPMWSTHWLRRSLPRNQASPRREPAATSVRTHRGLPAVAAAATSAPEEPEEESRGDSQQEDQEGDQGELETALLPCDASRWVLARLAGERDRRCGRSFDRSALEAEVSSPGPVG